MLSIAVCSDLILPQLVLQITPEHFIAGSVDDRVDARVDYSESSEQKENIALYGCNL